MRRLTQEEFLARAKEKYGDEFDYSNVEYKNMNTKVIIGCSKHGFFKMTPYKHLTQAYGCPQCEMDSRLGRPLRKKRSLISGFGILDVDFSRKRDKLETMAYRTWDRMIRRCYKKEYNKSDIKYKDCYVCEDWKYFSNFLKFFKNNYIDGFALDKDIIKKGNKCYCPEYCCFVPQRVNNLIENRSNDRGILPIGVHQTRNLKYQAQMAKDGKTHFIGIYDTIDEAFLAYKQTKENFIKEIAQEYYDGGLITERVFNALMNYKIDITD